MELLVILVFVALVAYAFGVGKQERDRSKRKVAEYNREWEEWRVKNNAVQDEHGKWHATTKRDQDSTT
jgi:hypothetical protein